MEIPGGGDRKRDLSILMFLFGGFGGQREGGPASPAPTEETLIILDSKPIPFPHRTAAAMAAAAAKEAAAVEANPRIPQNTQ